MFDTNIYIRWIRDGGYADLLSDYQTRKYISAIVLTELWAGTRKKSAVRIIGRLQDPYLKAGRVVSPSIDDYIMMGQVISDLPRQHMPRVAQASFVNDLAIMLTARSIGATLYTANRNDFDIISNVVPGGKVAYV